MKVWRGIGIAITALLLTLFLAIAAAWFALDRSVLDSHKTEAALANSGVYVIVRRDTFIPALTTQITQKFTPSAAVTTTDIIDSLRDAFPQDKVTAMSNTVIDATYQWLNKKSPDIEFSIPLTDAKASFLSALSTRVTTNLKKLPTCTRYSQVSEDETVVECTPPGTSVTTVHSAIMDKATAAVSVAGDAITPETIGLNDEALGVYRNAPDYLSYLWVANLVALPLAAFLTLYLLIKRRLTGVVVLGIVALVVSIACIIVGQWLGGLALPSDAAARAAGGALRPLVVEQLKLLAIIGGMSGIVLVIGGIVWMKLIERRRGREHYKSERVEE